MKKKGILVSFIVTLCFLVSCKDNKNEAIISQDIPVYDFEGLEPLLYTQNNKTYLINFWAMWCLPCVEELPYIQEYANKNPNVEVILVSMDFPKDIETKLKPFLKKNNITTKVVLLDDPDANSWINKINPEWSGAIPFTIMFNSEKRFYYERSFDDLQDIEIEISKNFNK
ncbi:TlpA family protein disulfide reductase [Algibacter lectus]|uniref:Thiol-disulfide isomerase/thioredoxin n=1 Tax=Algibacter lectus TaxID=221126 RepID=A0A4V3HHJ2_9FLAO|nr:TlpA disulfide reductase family protein [Algibacter lectus]MWW26759.1 redoxin domain-containing protein [Algibacter lectus]TDY65498.1 thiol-disulfide isomerase/thioredoxin [Algibacter lectus]